MAAPKNARLLLLSNTTGYQTLAFREAAERLGVPVTLGTDRCHVLEDPWRDGAIALRFANPEESAQAIVDAAEGKPLSGIVALGDQTTLTAAIAAEKLGLPHHPPAGARAAGDKLAARQRFQEAGLLVPKFARLSLEESAALPAGLEFPCVLKPLGLAASRGVIRADTVDQLRGAVQRIARLLETPDVRMMQSAGEGSVLVESFIPGREYALEGVMHHGRLRALALFDKPDPLDGPFFEETIYVTPSRLDRETQRRIRDCTERAVGVLGLHHGPVHAEMRVNEKGIWMLEVAARPIGGLCGRSVRFGDGATLEEFLIRHALGMPVDRLRREPQAAGVMMIPVPADGVLVGVEGVEEARSVAGIEEVIITAKPRQKLIPWPEGNSYPGFIFARGDSPDIVELALRQAHQRLNFVVTPLLAVVR